MTDQLAISQWIDSHGEIFRLLGDASDRLSQAAGNAGRIADRSEASPDLDVALAYVRRRASELLELTKRAEALPPIPDPDTQRHFTA